MAMRGRAPVATGYALVSGKSGAMMSGPRLVHSISILAERVRKGGEMSDKYEEWARTCYQRNKAMFHSLAPIRGDGWRFILELAFTYCAAKLEEEREKETCEWMRVERPYGTYFQAQCSAGIGVLRKHGAVAPYDDPDVLCPYCNRRIVEKVEK
jgi:DNA-directed RNA polymerase subunit RPC12/RpoP